METIFIATPVRVRTVGDGRRPDGETPAVLLEDERGATVIRIPTPDAPGGRPHLEAMALAGAQDICRQLNEIDAALRTAVREGGLEGRVEVGITATRRNERVIGAWHYTLVLAGGAESERVMVPVNAVSYEQDATLARAAVRQAHARLTPPRALARH